MREGICGIGIDAKRGNESDACEDKIFSFFFFLVNFLIIVK